MNSSKRYFFVATILLLISSHSHSQSNFIPYSEGYISERQEAFTMRASSAENFEDIPHREVYRAVFIRILGDPMLFQKLSHVDAQILLHLPDHTDMAFQAPLQADLRAACKKIDEQLGSKQVATLVSAFMGAEESYGKKLDNHYENVIRRLSIAGQELVVDQIAELAKGESLTYTETDYVGFSKEFPEVMGIRIASACERIEIDLNVPERKLLTDNFVHRRDFGLRAQ